MEPHSLSRFRGRRDRSSLLLLFEHRVVDEEPQQNHYGTVHEIRYKQAIRRLCLVKKQ